MKNLPMIFLRKQESISDLGKIPDPAFSKFSAGRQVGDDSGFIALISAIIISVLVLTITFTLSFSGFFARFNILDAEYKNVSLALAEACIDVAILNIVDEVVYTGNVPVGDEECEIDSITGTSTKTINVHADFNNSFTRLEAEVTVNDDDVEFISWKEVAL